MLVDEEGGITDNPELGRPLRKKDVAMATQRVAARAAEAMQKEIEDQLVECQYNAEVRKVLHDAAVLGTGVLCGPLVVKRTRKAWRARKDPASGKQIHELQIVEELKPTSTAADVVDAANGRVRRKTSVSVLFFGISRWVPKSPSTVIGMAWASMSCAARIRFRDGAVFWSCMLRCPCGRC